MNFIEISVGCIENYREILMAEMSQLSYDSMIETNQGFDAYTTEDLFDQKSVEDLFARYKVGNIHYSKKQIAKQNWNIAWEKNYSPIIINNQCIVRAIFHKIPTSYRYDIIITPKMSFGTGHHETTSQVLILQMNLDHQEKSVLDAGCGTGILSIMAEKRGARLIDSFDTDQWCVDSSEENYKLNGCQKCTIQ